MAELPVLRNDSLLFEDTGGVPQAGTIVPCLWCMKPFVMPMYLGTPDQICGECWRTYQDAARVICLGHGGINKHPPVTICRLKPKLLDNGFLIEPRMVLHTEACNVCKPGLKMSEIVEITMWMKIRRPPRVIVGPGIKGGIYVPFSKYSK